MSGSRPFFNRIPSLIVIYCPWVFMPLIGPVSYDIPLLLLNREIQPPIKKIS